MSAGRVFWLDRSVPSPAVPTAEAGRARREAETPGARMERASQRLLDEAARDPEDARFIVPIRGTGMPAALLRAIRPGLQVAIFVEALQSR